MKISTENGKKRKRAEWQETLVIVWETLKTGPKYPHEIYGVVKQRLGKKSRRLRTAERVLESLSEMGLVEKRDDGRYYLVNEVEKFRSLEEYQISLDHSKALLGLQQNRPVNVQLLLDNKFLREHIESAYPEMDGLIKKLEACQNRLTNLENTFRAILRDESEKIEVGTRILQEILEATLRMEEPTIERISELLSGEDLRSLMILEVKFGSKKVNLKNLTPDYILKLSNEVRGIYQKIADLKRECKLLQSEVQDCLHLLVLQVYYGTPLRGSCELCPKVRARTKK